MDRQIGDQLDLQYSHKQAIPKISSQESTSENHLQMTAFKATFVKNKITATLTRNHLESRKGSTPCLRCFPFDAHDVYGDTQVNINIFIDLKSRMREILIL